MAKQMTFIVRIMFEDEFNKAEDKELIQEITTDLVRGIDDVGYGCFVDYVGSTIVVEDKDEDDTERIRS